MIIDAMFGGAVGIHFMVHERETKRLLIADAYGTRSFQYILNNTLCLRIYHISEEKMKNEKNYIQKKIFITILLTVKSNINFFMHIISGLVMF
jgi:hypothetical protein